MKIIKVKEYAKFSQLQKTSLLAFAEPFFYTPYSICKKLS